MNLVPSPRGGIAAFVLSVVTVAVNLAVELGVDLTQGQQGAITSAASAIVVAFLALTNRTSTGG